MRGSCVIYANRRNEFCIDNRIVSLEMLLCFFFFSFKRGFMILMYFMNNCNDNNIRALSLQIKICPE